MPSDATAGGSPTGRAGSSGEALRILVVDENPRDRALITRALEEGFANARVTAVEDAGDLPRVLDAGAFDLVVADHRPAWVDAFALLERARGRDPDLPVLLCTGTGSEELAVAAMKVGFDDYVLKHPHHFPRLVPAIRSALEESTRRRIAREAETRYRTLFEGVPVGLYRATLSGQVLDANPALLQLLGFSSRESLMAMNLREVYVDPKARRSFLERLEREGEVHDMELQWKRYGGQIITVRKGARPVRDTSGRLLHYEGVVEDITERKRARQELQESNQFRQEIISGAGEGIVVYDRDLRLIIWNQYMERMTGLASGQVVGRKPLEIFPFLREQGLDRLLERALGGDTASSSDVPYTIPQTGRSGWLIATYGPHRDAAGQIVGVIGIVHDVTERRRAEQALRESEERFRRMADAAPVMIWTDDAQGMTNYFNKPWLDFTGRALETELGLGSRDSIHPDDRSRFAETYESARLVQRPFQTEYRLRRHDGEYRWVLETAIPRSTESGEFEGFIGSVIDISERRQAEDAVRESEERFRFMADAAPVMIWLDDEDARCTYFSKPWLDFTGRPIEAELGLGWCDGVHPDDLERIRADEAEARGRPEALPHGVSPPSARRRVPLDLRHRIPALHAGRRLRRLHRLLDRHHRPAARRGGPRRGRSPLPDPGRACSRGHRRLRRGHGTLRRGQRERGPALRSPARGALPRPGRPRSHPRRSRTGVPRRRPPGRRSRRLSTAARPSSSGRTGTHRAATCPVKSAWFGCRRRTGVSFAGA